MSRPPTHRNESMYVGVDVGSASVNVVGVTGDGEFAGSPVYVRIAEHASAVDALKAAFLTYLDSTPGWSVAGVGTTGSGRELNRHILGADITRTEIFAHAVGICVLAERGELRGSEGPCRRVGSVIEIGGQDAKVIVFDAGGAPVHFNMNSICSAGTGEFLQQIADEAGIPIADFGPLALQSDCPAPVDSTCTVFSKRDFRHLTQKGVPLADRLWGLCHAMAQNYLRNVVRGHALPEPVVFQGGVAANDGVRRAFEAILGVPVLRPPHHDVIGALGMAIIVRDVMCGVADHDENELPAGTAFRRDFMDQEIESRMAYCHGCPNSCELAQPVAREQDRWVVLDTLGGRCEGWAKPDNLSPQPPREPALRLPINRTRRVVAGRSVMLDPGPARVRSSEGHYFAAVDGGSRGTKAALVRSYGDGVDVIAVHSVATGGDALRALMETLRALQADIAALSRPGEQPVLSGFGSTGSAGELYRDILTTDSGPTGTAHCADYRATEILAHYAWAEYCVPEVGTVMDIGGNDAKIIAVTDHGLDFGMNDKCAAGTGAFVEAVAKRFHVPLEEFAEVALRSRHPARIAGRCAVFGESDIVHKSRSGMAVEDLFMGLAYAIGGTYLADVANGKQIRVPVVLQGGGFLNRALQRAITDLLQLGAGEVVIYDDSRHIVSAGALGAALLAKAQYERGYDSRFKGFDTILANRYETRTAACEFDDCERRCRNLIVLLENGTAISGYKSIDCDFDMFTGRTTGEAQRRHLQRCASA